MLLEQSTLGETACMISAAAADVTALKAFIDDNEDLERLETLLDQFNLFESLGLVRQEIRHSAFLRWLLDPRETHGLGDYWLRQFLRQVIKDREEISDDFLMLFDLDGWNLGQAEVRKEWRNIDVLILDDENKLVCAIENKVDSGESPGQLCRYRKIVEREFPGYKKSFVFLTIAGDAPSDDAYIPISYRVLVSTIDTALQKRQTQLNDEIKLFIQQYLDMVRRHIVEESEVQELCRRLYQNHRRALDLIFEHRPDLQTEVFQTIQKCIGSLAKSRGDLITEKSVKSHIRFLPKDMDIVPHQGSGEWTDSKRILLCEIVNSGGKVELQLALGPGSQQIREMVFDKAKTVTGAFGRPKSSKLGKKWNTFSLETWISPNEYEGMDVEELTQRINERMVAFLDDKGRKMAEALKELDFRSS